MAAAGADAAGPTIAVQRAAGRPRLEVVDGGPPRGGPAPGPLPPPPAAAEPVFAAPGGPEPARVPWTPEEASLAVTGAHNAAWTGALVLRGEKELLEPAYADPKELQAASGNLARLLDHTPLQPAGAGPLGILGDLLVAGQAVIALEVRHASLVSAARRRLLHEVEAPRPPSAPAAPRAPAAAPPSTPAPGGRPATTPPPPADDGEGGFRFSREQLAVLAGGNPLASHREERAL